MNQTPEQLAVIRALATRSLACPACGYDLRGNAAARCPECARAVTQADLACADRPSPIVVARRLLRAALITGLIVSTLLAVDVMGWSGGVRRSAFSPPGVRAAAALMLSATATTLAAWQWRRFRRATSDSTAAWIAIAAEWLLLLGSLAAYAMPA